MFMRLKDLLKKRQDTFQYNADMPVEDLVKILSELRVEKMFSGDESRTSVLDQQIRELTDIVSQKTNRPKREKWDDAKREHFSGLF